MLKSCQYCGKIHDSKIDCDKKPKREFKNTNASKFRHTRKWRDKRNQIVERDNYLCQVCKDKGRYVYTNLEVHHIIPIDEDYDKRLDETNLITLCESCHEKAECSEIARDCLTKLIK